MSTSVFEDDDSLFNDDPDQSTGDSSQVLSRTFDPNLLKVYQSGEVTVIGFESCDLPDDFCVAIYRDQLYQLIERYHCKVLKIDLSGFKLIPSGMLGLLVSLRQKVQRVVLCNLSADIRDVLEITHFDRLLEIQEFVEILPPHPTDDSMSVMA